MGVEAESVGTISSGSRLCVAGVSSWQHLLLRNRLVHMLRITLKAHVATVAKLKASVVVPKEGDVFSDLNGCQ